MTQRLIHGQATLQSASHCPIIQPLNAACFLEPQLLTAPFYHLRGAAIKTLLSTRRPSTVFGRVGAVIVDTINAEALESFAHVGKKVIVCFTPPGANINAASAIPAPSSRGRISAASDHSPINTIGSVRRYILGIGIAPSRRSVPFLAPSAASRPSTAQMNQPHISDAPAIAAALDKSDPSRTIASRHCRKLAQYRPFSERRANLNRLRVRARHRVHYNAVESLVKKHGVTALKAPPTQEKAA